MTLQLFFTNKTKTISSQCSPPLTQDPQPTRSTAQTPIFSFCPLTEAGVSKLLLSSHPTTCPLDPIPSHLLQAISPALLPALTHIINTSLLSAAFDTVNHQILLSTLSSLDITGIPLRWFESYLTGQSFRVAWGGEVSKAHQLVTGVPQGSVLGLLLFSTYTTSLAPIIQARGFSYHFYADDTQLYLSFRPDDPTVAARISGCLADISAWMKEHHLQLNLAKTELLVFPATPTLQHDFTIQLGSSTITPSASFRNHCKDSHCSHCKDCSILQVCITLHQKDQALSDRTCCTTSCPGPCHF